MSAGVVSCALCEGHGNYCWCEVGFACAARVCPCTEHGVRVSAAEVSWLRGLRSEAGVLQAMGEMFERSRGGLSEAEKRYVALHSVQTPVEP